MQVQLRSKASAAEVVARVGTSARPEDIRILVTGDQVSVFKPNGQRLLVLRRGALSQKAIDAAYPFMWSLRSTTTKNRGNYAGVDSSGARRTRELKRNGEVSNTNVAATTVRSAVAGYFDRYPRMPFCRETALSSNDRDGWGRALPYIQEIATLFREAVPDRYAAQLAEASRTHPAYVIPETPFTTVTVNNTVAGAYHTDRGDFEKGFGVISVFRRGDYRGAELVFPAYGVGVDLQHGDVVFCDVHEVHGNTPFRDSVGAEQTDWARISMVFYYRAKMVECLSPPEELARAKRLAEERH